MMNIDCFDYHLPEQLIACYPAIERTQSRLLVLDEKLALHHQHFYDLSKWLKSGDLLVMNNSKVMRARLYGKKPSGGKVELLIERVVSPVQVLAHVKVSKAIKSAGLIELDNGVSLEVLVRREALYELKLSGSDSIFKVMEQQGHIPLPPYMNRADELTDQDRYQTVYARHHGSVAAPTAGLHFSKALLNLLKNQGIELAEVTLHVGAGTFQPVKVDNLADHVMHSEWIDVPETVIAAINRTKARGGRIIAVGTTTVRSLEAAALSGMLRPYQGETQIFIYPGFQFKVIDGMITNFHLPKSTLLMLVSAFSGQEVMINAYQHAIQQGYRFFSYGDAMLLLGKKHDS